MKFSTLIVCLFLCLTGVVTEDKPGRKPHTSDRKVQKSSTSRPNNASISVSNSKSSLTSRGVLQLFSRQEIECIPADYVPCVDDLEMCCPPGFECFPEAFICCEADTILCPDDECYATGSKCCSEGGACAASTSCCDTGCCDDSSSCCSDGCCDAPNTTCCGTEWCCPPDTECCNGDACCSEDETCCEGGCCADGETCCGEYCCEEGYQCDPDNPGECLPVMTFPYTPLVLDQTVKNMCVWLSPAQQTILTWSDTRNDGGKCRGCCTGVTVVSGPYAGDATSCDEFPFATSNEALNSGAHLACVDAYENSYQGNYIMNYRNSLGLVNGQRYIVLVTGIVCGSVNPNDLLGCGGAAGGTWNKRSLLEA